MHENRNLILKKKMIDVFVHIHKTGGTTLNWGILHKNYSKECILDVHKPLTAKEIALVYLSLSEDNRKRIKLITGHFDFGIHEYINIPCRYFTLIRNPVDRVVSLYYFVKQTELGEVFLRTRGYKKEEVDKMNLVDFLESGMFPEANNGQVRMISGVGRSVNFGEVNEDLLRLAISNLNKYFSVIGITEYFDESLLLMALKFGWKRIWYTKSNVNTKKPRRKLSEKELCTLQKYNKMDILLYNYVREQFEKNLRDVRNFEFLLKFYKICNNGIYGSLKKIKNAAKNTILR
ncbi:hypothetical protein ABUL39_07710 [Rhodothermus marinus]